MGMCVTCGSREGRAAAMDKRRGTGLDCNERLVTHKHITLYVHIGHQ